MSIGSVGSIGSMANVGMSATPGAVSGLGRAAMLANFDNLVDDMLCLSSHHNHDHCCHKTPVDVINDIFNTKVAAAGIYGVKAIKGGKSAVDMVVIAALAMNTVAIG